MEEPRYINLPADKEVEDNMPTIELVECERVAYIKEMENYLQRLKAMAADEAQKQSRLNLESCHIIQSDGKFTERYRYSRLHYSDMRCQPKLHKRLL
ncbi:MAG: hypothetical protein HFG78_13630 [Hungatella sp.]|jgi:hypothetical protein|nr:hypothetical protein [Hungatella sp.]MCI9635932.1 hypothetical protein [Hungatella sp.]